MKKFLPGILLLILLSCKKSAQPVLQVRIANDTNIILDSVQLTYDLTNYNYGTVEENKETSYHSFQTLADAATANVVINGKQIIAGRIFPPNSYPYPILSKGSYTLKIFADSTLVLGYNAELIKE
ncbi:MAG: hypothetical protein ABJA35_16050 [Parafilimonas sp.]